MGQRLFFECKNDYLDLKIKSRLSTRRIYFFIFWVVQFWQSATNGFLSSYFAVIALQLGILLIRTFRVRATQKTVFWSQP